VHDGCSEEDAVSTMSLDAKPGGSGRKLNAESLTHQQVRIETLVGGVDANLTRGGVAMRRMREKGSGDNAV
jgi:hypothetical protein